MISIILGIISDNIFYSGIIIVNYNRENSDIILRKIIDTNINMNISVFYEILAAFVSGLFIRTNFTFSVENKEIFVIQKN